MTGRIIVKMKFMLAVQLICSMSKAKYVVVREDSSREGVS
jgi:hypothetical protein